MKLSQRELAGLSPFARARLQIIEEAQQKKGHARCLESQSAWGHLHASWWRRDFLVVALVAVFNASRAEYHEIISLYCDDELWARRATKANRESIGWILALKHLADLTGAPLLEAAKIVSGSYAESKLGYNAPFKNQFNILKKLWLSMTKYCNESDADKMDLIK